jgi:hypothetical protein
MLLKFSPFDLSYGPIIGQSFIKIYYIFLAVAFSMISSIFFMQEHKTRNLQPADGHIKIIGGS